MQKEVRFLLGGLIVGAILATGVWYFSKGARIGELQDVPVVNDAEPTPERMQDGIDKLKMIEKKEGSGQVVKSGSQIEVHYTGWLFDRKGAEFKGKQIDSSRERNQPFVFRVGAGQVIPGWDKGVMGMKAGGQRTLIIPPAMAYGDRGAGGAIPPNATLVFDVEVVSIKK